MGEAVEYALNQWESLKRYLEHGKVEIDNNLIENAIRPTALGKKNWMFIGHPKAGWRSAVIYSIIESCRRHAIEPSAYLTDVLKRLPDMNITEIAELAPANWKPTRNRRTARSLLNPDTARILAHAAIHRAVHRSFTIEPVEGNNEISLSRLLVGASGR